jgi:hypothetical protein
MHEAGMAAGPHFDEHDDRSVAHHEIDLAEPCAEVPREQVQAVPFEVRTRERFRGTAAFPARRGR